MRSTRLVHAAAAALAVAILAPSVAGAQPGAPPPPPPGPSPAPYYGPPVGRHQQPDQAPGGFWWRRGLTLGFSVGLGSTSNENGPIGCIGCDYDPVAVGLDFHIGGMITPRFALMFEAQGIAQTLDANGTETLVQSMGLLAGKLWVLPQLWIEGGLGGAHVAVNVDDGWGGSIETDGADGSAFLAAAGYEVLSSRHMAIDLQLRGTVASYQGFLGDNVSTGMFSVGFSWY